MARTMYDKTLDAHLLDAQADGTCLLYIDRHLVHEVTSPQAFEGLRVAGRKVRAPEKALAVADHNVPTEGRINGIADERAAFRLKRWRRMPRTLALSIWRCSISVRVLCTLSPTPQHCVHSIHNPFSLPFIAPNPLLQWASACRMKH